MNVQSDKVTEVVGIVIASVFLFSLIAEFVISRLIKKNIVSSEFLIINLSIASLQQLTDVLSKLIFITAFVFVQQHYSVQKLLGWNEAAVANPFSFSSTFPFFGIKPFVLLNYIFVLVIADFCQYWLHRASHEVNIMWAGHITHHSNTEYNFGVALRQNALENAYTWVFFLPLAFFGIPWQMFVTAYAVSLIWQFLVHTQLIHKMGFIEFFMSTPSHHRVHHGKNEQYIDKNYGAFFIIWDKLFGTFEPEVEPVEYGIVKPLQNQNPLWSNVHHHVHIFKSIASTKSWSDKLKVFLGKPAFVPNELAAIRHGGFETLSGLTENSSFTPQAEKKFYVFINFLLVAIVAFLGANYFYNAGNTIAYFAVLAVAIISFSIFSGLLENKKWADYAEVIRLAVIAVTGLSFLLNQQLRAWAITTLIISLLLLLSTGLIAARYKKHFSMAG